MPGDWNFYLCTVNDILASVFLDLELRKAVPDKTRPTLLWVWVKMKTPRGDGLSDSSEFESLKAIEEKLTEKMAEHLGAVFCGRITTAGRREFYYYAPRSEPLAQTVNLAASGFHGYKFAWGQQADAEWSQYLNVLYPNEEQLQCISNRNVLAALEKEGDPLKAPRDIWHWIYFQTAAEREKFLAAATKLNYRVEPNPEGGPDDFPFGLEIVRFQSIDPFDVDEAVIELFRLAKAHRGDYDGWETQVISQ